MSDVKSNDPGYTVTPQVLASNLIVLGSIPPVLKAEDVTAFYDHHGKEYSDEFFTALATYGISVSITR